MTDRFNQGALRVAVAQICQSMGWDALQKSTHDLLTDVMQKYMEEIAKSAYEYCQLYCHTEPNLDDLGLAFNDTGVLLHELEDYVSQVDQAPFIHQLPRFPLPKACVLHHPLSGEIVDRAEYYHEHLPALIKALQPNEDEREGTPTENKELGNGHAQHFLRSEIKTIAEETHNDLTGHMAEKRSLGSPPPDLELDTKRRRLEGPFLGKNNKENEMDILQALQEKISQSASPSPDIVPVEADDKGDVGVFKFASTPALHLSINPSTQKEAASKPLKEKKVSTPASSIKSPDPSTSSGTNRKPNSAKKKSPQKAASKPKAKAKASPKVKSKSKSPIKSPTKSPLGSPPKSKTKTETSKAAASHKKTSKKLKLKSENVISITSPQNIEPQIQAPLPIASIKKELPDKPPLTMPKLIIKPVKQETSSVAEYSVAEMLSSVVLPSEGKKEKTKQTESPGEPKPKKKKKKGGTVIKTEPGSVTPGSSSMFSIANFLPPSSSTPTPGGDRLSEHTGEVIKKRKKKHKDKDKLKSKDKDRVKIKKIKQEPQDLLYDVSTPSSSSTAIPRIKLKLEPPSSTPLATKEGKKPHKLFHPMKEGKSKKTSSHTVTAGPSSEPVVHIKQETDKPKPDGSPSSATLATPAGQSKEAISRMVITETLSSTVQLYFCPACRLADDGSFMIGCDNCDKWYHGACVGVINDPGGDWYCTVCAAKKSKKKKKKKSKDKDKLKTM